MLETILKKSKNLIKKAKKPLLTTLAGLTLLTVASGCRVPMGYEWVKKDTRRKTVYKPDFEKRFIIKYNLGNKNIQQNKLIIPVKENKHELTYQGRGIKEEWVYREQENFLNEEHYATSIGIGAGIGLGLGFVIGLSTPVRRREGYWGHRKDTWPHLDDWSFSLAFLGALIGLICTEPYYKAHPEKYKKRLTGNIKIEDKGESGWSIDKLTSKVKLYSNETAKFGTAINLSSEDMAFKKEDGTNTNSLDTITNLFGEVKEEIAEFPYNKALIKEKLEEKIKSSEIIQDIKDQTRRILLPQILKKMESVIYTTEVKTTMESTSGTTIVNDEKIFTIWAHEIPEEKIYLVLEDFINKEINSRIKEVRIKVKDESTHTAVRNATLEVKTEAPTRTQVAKKYFEDDLLNWSINKIKDYITGKEKLKYDDNGVVVFSAYTPNNYNTETTNPNYRFVNLNFDFSDRKLKKTIYMSKDPKLIKIVDE